MSLIRAWSSFHSSESPQAFCHQPWGSKVQGLLRNVIATVFFCAFTELSPTWPFGVLAVVAALASCPEAFRILLLRNQKQYNLTLNLGERGEKKEEAEIIWLMNLK